MNVLLVDDDSDTLALLGRALTREGHTLVSADNAAAARAAMVAKSFDVIVLDVMLEQASGLELCAWLREQANHTPVLFLSARGTVRARLDGFEAGGDDYLPKPFAVKELLMRVRALGRRSRAVRPAVVSIGAVVIDLEARRALVSGREVPITSREWDILRVLAAAEGRVVSFDDLLERVWGEASDNTRASLEVIISRMRRKLEGDSGVTILRTARGSGYALAITS